MLMFVQYSLLGLAVASRISAWDPWARLDKALLAYDFRYFENGIRNNAERHTQSITKWDGGWIPEQCKYIVEGNVFSDVRFNPNDIEVYNVLYDDCRNDAWVFCRHKNVGPDIDSLASQFGRLPIAGGLLYDGAITFMNPTTDMLPTIMHETGHALDLMGAYGQQLSNQDDWWNNYYQDSRVPDNYAQSNQVENVAQNTVVAWFDNNAPGGVGSVEPNWNLIFHQYATLQRKAGNMIVRGADNGNAQCTHRLPASRAVSIDGRSASAASAEPDTTLSEEVTELVPARSGSNMYTNCTLAW